VVENVLSTIDVVHCKSLQLQVTQKAPTILVDNTDGCQVFLSKEGLATEVFTSKTTEINISIPKDDSANADMIELPVPEQLKTVIENGKLVTTTVEHAG
jgi:adenylyl cyclase-associated protein